jgi:hypothetical protein
MVAVADGASGASVGDPGVKLALSAGTVAGIVDVDEWWVSGDWCTMVLTFRSCTVSAVLVLLPCWCLAFHLGQHGSLRYLLKNLSHKRRHAHCGNSG